jgi:hypothetical protein
MRSTRTQRGRARLTALAHRRETPYERARRRREQVRETFLDARDELRAVLEDLVEEQTRAVCPDATGLEVEVYNDELGEPRGRLLAVETDGAPTDEQHDAVTDRVSELLDEWATVANVDSTEIYFRLPAGPARTAPG